MVQFHFTYGEFLLVCAVACVVSIALVIAVMLIAEKISDKKRKKQTTDPEKVDTLVRLLAEKGTLAARLQTAEKQLAEEKRKGYHAKQTLYDVIFYHMMTPENESFLAKELQKHRAAATQALKENPDDPNLRGEKLFFDEIWDDLRTVWHFDHEPFWD